MSTAEGRHDRLYQTAAYPIKYHRYPNCGINSGCFLTAKIIT